jgi:integration host factor subunit alpha
MTMTKAEMITRLCEKARLSKDDAIKVIDGTFEIIKSSLERGEQVKITGFGLFVVRTKQPRKGRNPQTGAEIVIPGRKILAFKASPIMRKTVETTPGARIGEEE